MRKGPITKDTSTLALGLAQVRVGSSLAGIADDSPRLAAAASIGSLVNTKFIGNTEFFEHESGFPLLKDFSVPIREAASMECSFEEITPYNLALANGLDPVADVAATVEELESNTTLGTTTGNITVNNLGGVEDEVYTVVFTTATSGKIYGKASGMVHTFANLTTIMAPDNGGQARFSIPANFFSGTWATDQTYVFKTTAFVLGTNAYANTHSGEIALGGKIAPAYVRMEAVYTFPNGVNTMVFIFPKAQVKSSVEVDMQAENPAASPITFESNDSSEDAGGNAVWNNKPLGVIVFN
jgi:hypothetical protein